MEINWTEFRDFKKDSVRNDNFETLLDFMKSYYNMMNPMDLYDTFKEDATAQMMLKKRNIIDAEGIENYLFKLR